MSPNELQQTTAAAPSVLDGAGDSLRPGSGVAQFPAAVSERLR